MATFFFVICHNFGHLYYCMSDGGLGGVVGCGVWGGVCRVECGGCCWWSDVGGMEVRWSVKCGRWNRVSKDADCSEKVLEMMKVLLNYT